MLSYFFPQVSHHRSWTKLGVMTAAQRDELLKRVVKKDPREKLSFKECGKIAKDLNLTLEQVNCAMICLISFLTSGSISITISDSKMVILV